MAFPRINPDHRLFVKLRDDQPEWWKNLVNDSEIYLDIRKDYYINAYYKGGSLMKLSSKRNGHFKGEIHLEYVPFLVQSQQKITQFKIIQNSIEFDRTQLKIPDLSNFEGNALTLIKNRIDRVYTASSEKAIQSKIVTRNNSFLDTEFQIGKSRIDLIWVDNPTKRIVFVELKTIGDERLYFGDDLNTNTENIPQQMEKYANFLIEYRSRLEEYYRRIFLIKKQLGILPAGLAHLGNLNNYAVETKPLLLVSGCTNKWIEYHAQRIDESIKNFALGSFYYGKTTFKFYLPSRTRGNKHIYR